MTGDGEGIRNLAMACGLVGALDFTDVDGAAQWMFDQARDKHVSAATIFIGRGKGDDQHGSAAPIDAALTFALLRGDGNVQVFTANPGQYYDSDAELAAAKLGPECRGFAEKIAAQRELDQHCPHAQRRVARASGRAHQEPAGKHPGGIFRHRPSKAFHVLPARPT